MRTRSQARRLRQQQLHQQQVPPNLVELPIVTMADNRTMAELLQAPTEGYEDAIVVPEIEAANFEIKHGLLTLVQNRDCSSDIHEQTRIWLEKEPPRSIQTWDDLVAKFINQFFPPSKTTNLRNEITNFKQRFDESFSEAWDRFKRPSSSAILFEHSAASVGNFLLTNEARWLLKHHREQSPTFSKFPKLSPLLLRWEYEQLPPPEYLPMLLTELKDMGEQGESREKADLLFDDAHGVDCFPKQVIWDLLRDIGYEGTDKSKITRKQSKASKHGHENQKSAKPKPRMPKS
ncbi:reverse transcriptase domain-containing protein [Tanacetum coccineum]